MDKDKELEAILTVVFNVLHDIPPIDAHRKAKELLQYLKDNGLQLPDPE